MNRFFILSFWFLSTLIFFNGQAFAQIITGTTSNGLTFSVANDTATITGYSGAGGAVAIPSTISVSGSNLPVTSIEAHAFNGCINLTSLTIPSSITTIGDNAFENCANPFTTVFLGNAPTIGQTVFSNDAYVNVYFKSEATGFDSPQLKESSGASWWNSLAYNGITSDGLIWSSNNVEVGIVGYSGSGTSVTIPDFINVSGSNQPVTSIRNSVFYGCLNLTSAFIGNSVTTIGEDAFVDCSNLTNVFIGKSVTTIGDYAFCDCYNLTGTLTIPDSVTYIGNGAFSNCFNLTGVIIGNGVTFIGDDAFADCSDMTNLTIGNSVTHIGMMAFDGCSNLTGTLTIPDSVTFIGDLAFGNCFNLTSLIIGNSLNKIGEFAFNNCFNLTSAIIGNSVTSIGNGAFSNCFNLTGTITIPNSVTSIGNGAFGDCSKLTGTIIIPNNVTSIGGGAFSGCSNLTGVFIGKNVTTIGDGAFSGCYSLTATVFLGNAPEMGMQVFNETGFGFTVYYSGSAIGYDPSLWTYGLYFPWNSAVYNGITSDGLIWSSTNGQASIVGYSGTGGSVTIPDTITISGSNQPVTSIGNYAFWKCSDLTSVIIGTNITGIGADAFYGCGSLSYAVFLGNAPAMNSQVFTGDAIGFTVYYSGSATGFESPQWTDSSGDTWPAVYLKTPSPAYSNWQNTVFGVNAFNPTIAGDTQVNNNAGIPNLLAYALGVNPYRVTVQNLPSTTVVTGSAAPGSGNYLSIQFNPIVTDTSLTFTVEVSNNLAATGGGWYPLETFNGISWTGSGTVIQSGVGSFQIIDSTPVGSVAGRFIRLRVSN